MHIRGWQNDSKLYMCDLNCSWRNGLGRTCRNKVGAREAGTNCTALGANADGTNFTAPGANGHFLTARTTKKTMIYRPRNARTATRTCWTTTNAPGGTRCKASGVKEAHRQFTALTATTCSPSPTTTSKNSRLTDSTPKPINSSR